MNYTMTDDQLDAWLDSQLEQAEIYIEELAEEQRLLDELMQEREDEI